MPNPIEASIFSGQNGPIVKARQGDQLGQTSLTPTVTDV
jgi:hypothetical protein